MKKHFITGLVILLPLAVTVAIVVFIVNFLTLPFVGAVKEFLIFYDIAPQGLGPLSHTQVIHYGSQILILIGIMLFTVIIGVLTRWFMINSLIRFGDYLLHQIPIVNKVYKTSQDLIQTIFESKDQSFKQVVMVPFPTPNIFCIGLVTRQSPPVCRQAVEANLVSVFVPTTPNPTSGYLLMFKKEDLHYLDMPVEDAVKFIISCGVVYPPGPVTKEAFDEAASSEQGQP